MSAPSSYSTTVQELYIAYFGRPADATGLANFESTLATLNAPTDINSLTAAYTSNPAIQTLIDSFGTSTESTTLYGNVNSSMSSIENFVTSVFQHVLNRAPASQGLAFWSQAISNGSLNLGNAALAIAAGALTNTTAQGLLDQTTITNKAAVASDFTAATVSQQATSEYAGANAAQIGRNLLSGVTSSTVLASDANTVNSAVASLATVSSAGTTFTLTTDNDNFTGTAQTNTFNAVINNGVDSTLTAGDVLTGAGGTSSNILNIIDDGQSAIGSLPAATLSNINTINLTSSEAISGISGAQLDLSGLEAEGLTAFNVLSSSGNDNIKFGTVTNASIIEQGSATLSLAGGNTVMISDTNYNTANANTLTTVTLNNAGTTTIESNALTQLSITNNSHNVTVDAAAGNRTLNLALNNVGSSTISDATATVVNITDNALANSKVSLLFASATSISYDATNTAYNDNPNTTWLDTFVGSHVSTVTISSAGEVFADFTGLSPRATINATATINNVYVTLAPGQSYIGSTVVLPDDDISDYAESIVTISAAPTGTINAGAGISNELILNNFDTSAPLNMNNVSNFSQLVLAGTTGGTLNMANAQEFSSYVIENNSTTAPITFINTPDSVSLGLTQSFNNTITVQYNVAGGSSSGALLFYSNNVASTIYVNQVIFEDNASNNVTDIYLRNYGTANGEIGTITGLSLLDVARGSNDVQIDHLNTSAKVFSLSDGGKGTTITDFNDNSLSYLNISATNIIFTSYDAPSNTIITNFNSTASTLNLNFSNSNFFIDGGEYETSGTFSITNFNDSSLVSATFINDTNAYFDTITIGNSIQPHLATLNLSGYVIIGITGDTVTTGITVSGGTDDANVSFSSTGVTASGATDSVTLGNGNDTVTLGAGVADSTHRINLGTGNNVVTDNTLGSTLISINGTAGGTETIQANSASWISINAVAASNNTISVLGTGTTGGIDVGGGANTISLGNGAQLIVTLGTHTATDTITVGTSGTSTTAIVQITGLNNAGSDTITFAGDQNTLSGVTSVTAQNVTASGLDSTQLASWIAVADGYHNLVSGSAHSVTSFVFNGNTYLLESVAGQTTDHGTMAAGNTVVELTGTNYTFTHTTGNTGGVLHLLG